MNWYQVAIGFLAFCFFYQMRLYRQEINLLRSCFNAQAGLNRHRLSVFDREEWHEEEGPVLWYWFPICEPPYVGTPLDDGFPEYVTHWQRLPDVVDQGGELHVVRHED